MSPAAWNTILFALKWILIVLIYLALFNILMGVRREMSLRLGAQKGASYAPGRLQVVSPGSDPQIKPGAVFNLAPENSLGSEKDNAIVLRDRFTSRHHARLRWDGMDWWLEDLGSRNGSYVNEGQLLPHQPERVPSGAVIRLGDTVFRLLD